MKNVFFLSCVLVFSLHGATYKSQYGQDRFLHQNFFQNKNDGIFIDIGAHDGITLSNSWFFEHELGWKGICFEPLPSVFEQLGVNRNCICLNNCVAGQEGEVIFREVVGYSQMLSGIENSYDPLHKQRIEREIKEKGGSYKYHSIKCRVLNNVLKEHDVSSIDLISLDVEGSEFEILKSIDYEKFFIKVICVENVYNIEIIRDFLLSKGFSLVTRIECDDVFLNNANIS